jgi:hypothetical protein
MWNELLEIGLALMCLLVFILPALTAAWRRHHRAAAITILNVFLVLPAAVVVPAVPAFGFRHAWPMASWFVPGIFVLTVGWLAAMVWASTGGQAGLSK